MARAILVIRDIEGEADPEIEVAFDGGVDNSSPAHQMVAEFIKFANMQEVKKD